MYVELQAIDAITLLHLSAYHHSAKYKAVYGRFYFKRQIILASAQNAIAGKSDGIQRKLQTMHGRGYKTR